MVSFNYGLNQKAQRILTAAQGRSVTPVAGSIITPTQGASGANSTIRGVSYAWNGGAGTGSATTQPSNAKMDIPCPPVSLGGSGAQPKNLIAGGTVGAPTRVADNGWTHTFLWDGISFDMALQGGTNNAAAITAGENNFRIRAMDMLTRKWEWVTDEYTLPYNDPRYYLINLGSRSLRVVQVVYGKSVIHRGFNFLATDTVSKPPIADRIAMALLADSYGQNYNANACSGGYIFTLGDLIGATAIVPTSQASTGWCTAAQGGGNGAFSYPERLAAGDLAIGLIGEQDIVFYQDSINDDGATDVLMASQKGLGIATLIAAQPTAILVNIGTPRAPKATPTSQAQFDARKAAWLAAANLDANPGRHIYLDSSPNAGNWLFGTGYAGSTTGDGNNDNYIDTDRIHFKASGGGHRYFGSRVAAGTLAGLRSIIADGSQPFVAAI